MGLPYRRVVAKHAVRNALMAPITVIMLHVNWLLGGIVVVEVIFGYPGLGSYLLDSALFKDFNAIEGGAIILVAVAVTDSGRPLPRVGGLTLDEIEGKDGLR